jgi:alpha-amylase
MAENAARSVQAETLALVAVETRDFNLDTQKEVCVSNMHLAAYLRPASGGSLYELDARVIGHNLLGTLSRRPEAYHDTIVQAAAGGKAASTVSRVVAEARFKHEGLDQLLHYDRYLRKGLLDHFFAPSVTLADLANLRERELGDFCTGPYEVQTKQTTRAVHVVLQRQGWVDGHPVKLAKVVGLEGESDTLQVRYVLEGLPVGRAVCFAVEWNFAGLAAGQDDRYYHCDHQPRAGQLQTLQDVEGISQFGLTDEWLGLDVILGFSKATSVWAFPVQTVSQSEGGFELVYQSSAVLPHWLITGDTSGRWEITMNLRLDTSRALRPTARG